MKEKEELMTVGKILRDYGTLIIVALSFWGTLWLGFAWGGYKLVEVMQVQQEQQTQINALREQYPLIQYQLSDVADSVNSIKKKMGIF